MGRKCDGCGTELVLSIPGLPEDSEQYDDALVLQVHGGYGMYVDILTRDEADRLRFVLCKGCADRLVAANPFMGRVFGYCGHTG